MHESSKSRARSKTSAGLLMFRRKGSALEVLLVHPGGPLFAKKDEGAWTIPKGEATPEEDLLTRAQIEFEEELGIPEIDRAEFFTEEVAGRKINPAQAVFLDRLRVAVDRVSLDSRREK